MSLEAALVARAIAYTTLNNLISGRFYANETPERPTYPCVVYEVAGIEYEGTLNADSSIARASVELTLLASSKSSLLSLADAVRGAFRRYRGTSANVRIYDVRITDEQDVSAEPDLPDVWLRQVTLSVLYRA